MKILWIKTDFLHPPTRGGRIRTLETLRRLHARHEVHYLALDTGEHPEALAKSAEYCTRAYAIPHQLPKRPSPAFAFQLARNFFSELPLSSERYKSAAMARKIDELCGAEAYGAIVCDFLTPSVNIRSLRDCVLFQHNVETVIWRRHAATAPDPLQRAYFRYEARRVFELERRVCRSVRNVIAVSPVDAGLMKNLFGIGHVSDVPTGVDLEYFSPPASAAPVADLVFVGSMDWMPNTDGIQWFVRKVLPIVRRSRPSCSLAIVGKDPEPGVQALAQKDPRITVTGTVPDVRPYLWGSRISVVPLRIGGGTRLKIYEAMAARTPVVSTVTGAEGLAVSAPENIRLGDSPEAFAAECLRLLEDPAERVRQAAAGWHLVSSRFSWDRVIGQFEAALEGRTAPAPARGPV